MLELVLEEMITEKNIHTLFIDGKKPKWYSRKIKKILRDKAIPLKKVRTVRSGACPGIRLADLVAGLTRWHFDNKNNIKTREFFLILKKKSTFFSIKKEKPRKNRGQSVR